jgi:hypothetical protein
VLIGDSLLSSQDGTLLVTDLRENKIVKEIASKSSLDVCLMRLKLNFLFLISQNFVDSDLLVVDDAHVLWRGAVGEKTAAILVNFRTGATHKIYQVN